MVAVDGTVQKLDGAMNGGESGRCQGNGTAAPGEIPLLPIVAEPRRARNRRIASA
jgi:hypothetical protein